MARWTVFGMAFAALCGASLAYEMENGVYVLGDADLDVAVAEFPYLMVEFYAPWCGHCKQLAPEYEAAAESLKKADSPVKLAKVDATLAKESAAKHKVEGYPTIFFSKNGNFEPFEGGRTADAIVDWVSKKTGPPATELKDASAAKEWVEKALAVEESPPTTGEDGEPVKPGAGDNWRSCVLGLFADQTSKNAKTFLKMADAAPGFKIAISSNKEVLEEYKVKGDAVIVLRNFDDEKRVTYSGDFSFDDLSAWMSSNQWPLVQEFDVEKSSLFGSNIKGNIFLFVRKSSAEFGTHMSNFEQVAKTYKQKVHALWLNVDGEADQQALLKYFTIDSDKLPAARIITRENVDAEFMRFAPEGDRSDPEALTAFLDKFLSGGLRPAAKSQPEPEDNTGPVMVLVGSTHEKITKDPKLNVFVEYYAPWCGHCKALAPIWDQLGTEFEDHENVIIAKMDATENEVHGVKIEGFPTLKFFPAGSDRTPRDYNGGRELDALVGFVTSDGVGVKASPAGELKVALSTLKTAMHQSVKAFGTAPTDDGIEAIKKAAQAYQAKFNELEAFKQAQKGHDEL